MALQVLIHQRHGGGGIGLASALGLRNDVVDAAQAFHFGGGVLQRARSVLLARCVLPHDGGAALRRDYGVDRVLEHQHAVGDCQRKRSAGAAFTGDGSDGRHAEARHLEEVARDGLALAALLGAKTGVRAGEVDEGKYRAAELLRDLHGAQRLAIALGIGHAELARGALLQRPALEIADDHHGLIVKGGHAAAHRGIVAEGAVAVDLAEVVEERLNIVHGIGPLGMSRNLCLLPCLGDRLGCLRCV